MKKVSANLKIALFLLGALLLNLASDLLILVVGLRNYLPVSILTALISFGTVGLIIGYNYKTHLPLGLIISVILIRILAAVGTHGLNIYEILLHLSIIAVFIDLGISLRAPQLYR